MILGLTSGDKTIINPAGQQFTKTIDDAGNLSNATSPGGNVTYTYHSSGLPKTITAGSSTTTIEYDEYGRQKKLIDPDAGATEYEYNAFGDLIMQLDANGNKTELTYDHLRRIELKTITDKNNKTINIKYTYITSGNGLGNIKKIEEWGTSTSTSYEYDQYSRVIKVTENIDGQNFVTMYEYDNFSNVTKTVYPSGYAILNNYDANGFLKTMSELKDASSGIMKILFNTDKKNALNQYKEYTVGANKTLNTYNDFGMLNTIQTTNTKSNTVLQDYEIDWNTTTGNPNFRAEHTKGQDENFGFDNLNQLTQSQANGQDAMTVQYLSNSNILNKTNVGTYEYSTSKPHAVEYISNMGRHGFNLTQTIKYNSQNMADTIKEDNYKIEITYGADGQRRKTVIKNAGTIEKEITYVGNYEKIKAGSNTYEVHYINNPAGIIAMNIRKNQTTDSLFVVHTDHLGSILKLTDWNGNTRYEQSFDPWGRERNPVDWSYTFPVGSKPVWLIRGFTGHEHLIEVKLINMNARLYDPFMGRMLSPDNYVQDATSTQSYNRYSYVENNPLVYTDPSGEYLAIAFWGIAFAGEFLSNGINGYGWSAKTAYNSASTTTSNISSVAQFPIYSNGNTTVTAGLDPFALGVSANVSHTQGNTTVGGGVGIGLTSGPFANAGVGYSTGDWNFGISGGVGGNSYSYGGRATYKGYGLGYTYTHYGAGTTQAGQPVGAQNTGSLTGYWPGGSFRIENDFFAFEGKDRWRTNAWELSVGNFSVGSYIYTNDPKGEGSGVDDNGTNLLGKPNKHGFGAWEKGTVYSSPLWFGYRVGNSISRIGYSHPLVQDRTQNVIHKSFPPGYQNFYNQYTPSAYGVYGYSGYYNPYSLY